MDYSSYTGQSLFHVKGKVAIVTGGGSGIGKGMAIALAMNGAKVIICGRRKEVIEATAQEINDAAKNNGGEVTAIHADVSNKAGVEAFYEECAKHITSLDLLVNNAGFSSNWKVQTSFGDKENLEAKLWSIDDVDFQNMTGIHVAGPYFLAVKFLPLFRKSTDPSVVNITSMAAFFLNRAVCEFSYAQSKAAEAQLTRLMAAALGPFGVRVNSVCPGLFPSGLTTSDGKQLYAIMEEQIANIPKGRVGKWEEIAGPVLMLASPAGSFFNGANFLIDGGWSMHASANDV